MEFGDAEGSAGQAEPAALSAGRETPRGDALAAFLKIILNSGERGCSSVPFFQLAGWKGGTDTRVCWAGYAVLGKAKTTRAKNNPSVSPAASGWGRRGAPLFMKLPWAGTKRKSCRQNVKDLTASR